MSWQHSRELLRRHKVAQSIDQSSMAESERPSQAVSVMTPSVAHFSRATSTDYRNYHVSNPNPQVSQQNFRGPRDAQSQRSGASPDKNFTDFIRFGKRIQFGN